MQVNVHAGATTPISEQIRAQVTAAIAALDLRSGDRLTPPGELAAQLVASPTAVLKAYRSLEADGLCRQGEHGFEVAPATVEQQRERARQHQLNGSRQSLIDELELARRIQRRLLPAPLVEARGYTVAARAHAAEFVSGDFYDVIERGGGVVDIVVADVSGKGVGASLIMAFVKARLPMLSAALPVAEVLRQLNAQLHPDLGPRQFVAMAYARFHGDGGRIEVANAGLPYPHLLRPGAMPEAVMAPGPSLPLGVRPDLDYASVEAFLSPGDRLLIYSDGIPEAPTAAGEPLGYLELTELLESYAVRYREADGQDLDGRRPSLLDWLDGLLGQIAVATDGALADDQTALVLERPVQERPALERPGREA